MNRKLLHITAALFCLLFFSVGGKAQFRDKGAFSQNYNEPGDTLSTSDTTDRLFSFKDYFGGLSHKHTIKIGTMFAGSVFFPGSAQIYNKDYWKLPIIYGGIGAFAGTGGYYLHRYNKSKKAYDNYFTDKAAYETEYGVQYPKPVPVIDHHAQQLGSWLMVGAGLVYWGSLMDGVVCYESVKNPLPGRATLYSALLPGLGQIYNGEYFKVPIYWGGLMTSVYFLTTNNKNYVRFKRIHNEATSPGYTGNISGETAKWYRDVYRRYRDYSIVATVLVYLLQVIDANVFAYMHDFEVSDDIALKVEPAVLAPDNVYAINPTSSYTGHNPSAFGLKIGLKF